MLQNLVACRSLVILDLPRCILLLHHVHILLMRHILKSLEIPLINFVELLGLFVLNTALDIIVEGQILRF